MTVGRIIRPGATANEILRARAVRHAVYFQRLRTHEVHQIIGILNRDVYPEIGARLTDALRDALVTGEQLTASAERLLRIQELTGQLIRAGLATVRDTLSEDLQAIAMAEAEWQVVTLAQATPIEWDFTTPSPSTLRALVTGDPLGADPIAGWFDDITASARDLVSKQLRTGIAGGETVDQLVRRVAGSGGLVDRNRHQVEAVVRTSCTDVAARARAQTYQDNADIVKGYQFVATLDSRTTLICASNDGKEFPNSDTEHMPPLHPNCRSTTTPVLRGWQELGIAGLRELPAGARASLDGEVADTTTFGEWLKSEPKAVQDEVLGPTRGDMFRAGKFEVSEFVDQSGRKYTLAELAARDAAN